MSHTQSSSDKNLLSVAFVNHCGSHLVYVLWLTLFIFLCHPNVHIQLEKQKPK